MALFRCGGGAAGKKTAIINAGTASTNTAKTFTLSDYDISDLTDISVGFNAGGSPTSNTFYFATCENGTFTAVGTSVGQYVNSVNCSVSSGVLSVTIGGVGGTNGSMYVMISGT